MAKIVRGSTLYDHETPLLDDLADLLYLALPTLILFELMIVPSVWSFVIGHVELA